MNIDDPLRLGAPTLCALAFAPLLSCTMSELAPDAEVAVNGLALDHRGNPLADRKIAMVEEVDLGEALFGLTVAPLTVLSCFGERPAALCQRAHLDTTDGAGRFGFALEGRDTQGSIGNASYFNLVLAEEASGEEVQGPATMMRFLIQREELALPTVQLWDPGLTVSSGGGSLELAIDGGPRRASSLRFESGPDYAPPLWEIDDPGTEPLLDLRVLEDAEVNVVAQAVTSVETGSGTFDIVQRSAATAYASPAGAPPSRGAGCEIRRADGAVRTLSPCALTDGELIESYPRADEQPCPEGDDACHEARREVEAIVDLGDEREVELIVARASHYAFDAARVEISTDGASWRAVGPAGVGSFEVELDPGTRARYVRLTPDRESGSVSGTRELSVW